MTRSDTNLRLWGRRVSRMRRRFALAGIKFRRSLAAGIETSGECDYQTGDDFRYVDWARCARHDELVSRRYAAILPMPHYLLIDGAASMTTGHGKKFAFARQLAAGLQACAEAQGESVHVYSGGANSVVKIDSLEDADIAPVGGPTDLASFCRRAVALDLEPGVVVLISDLLDIHGLEQCFTAVQRQRQQLFVLHVVDREDAEPTWTGRTRLVDAVGRAALDANIDEQDLAEYRHRFREWLDQMARFCLDRRIGYSRAWSDERPEAALERMLV